MFEYSVQRCMCCKEGIIILKKIVGQSQIVYCDKCLNAHEVRLFKNKTLRVKNLNRKPENQKEIDTIIERNLKKYENLLKYLKNIQ